MGVLVTEKQFKGHGSEYCLYPLRRNEKSLTLFHGWWWWFSCEVVSDSCDPLGVELARLLCSWDSLGKNTGVDCHFLLHVLWLNYCYFVLLDLTVCFLHFLTSLIKFILWSFSTDRSLGGQGSWGRDHKFSCSISRWSHFDHNKNDAALNNRNVISPSCGDQNSEIKVWAGPLSLWRF